MDDELYLDAASTQAVDPDVIKAMLPYWVSIFANPASAHTPGKTALEALRQARRSVAADLGAKSDDVVFTSGGTESDNLAVKGIAMAVAKADPNRRTVVISDVEHPAVGESAAWLECNLGFHVVRVPVDECARIDLERCESIIDESVAVVSVTLANNEVGTIQPIAAVADIAHRHHVPIHTDAVQAAGLIPVSMHELGVDALSISGHKFGAPKGLGALLIRGNVPYEPLISGGGQERGRRSGTQNVAGAVGLATALHKVCVGLADRSAALVDSRDRLIESMLRAVPEARLTGDPHRRLPGHASFVFPGVAGEALLVDLDARGMACSSGSACGDGSGRSPETLLATGLDAAIAKTSIRITFHEPLNDAQIARASGIVAQSYMALKPRSTTTS